jgi:hypothetical protein
MSKTSVQVAVSAEQGLAFTRLHDHLIQSGAFAAASATTVDEPRCLAYSLQLKDGTTQVTTLELTPAAEGCLLAMSVELNHEGAPAGGAWLTPKQLEQQHKTLAEIFARIANGGA